MSTRSIISVPLSDLKPSKLNPRHTFPPAYIAELAESIKIRQITPLNVRPDWCVGTTTRAELDSARKAAEGGSPKYFDIVSGECRYRAAKAAALAALEVIVVEITDPEYLDLNMVEQLQRNGLTVLEESAGFADMLKFKNEDGKPRHTVESIAVTIGKSTRHIYQRLSLLDLPDAAKKAVGEGKLPPSVAFLIARIPDEELAGEATKILLKGGHAGEGMTRKEAEAWIAENCMRSLNGAPFEQEDDTLVRHLPQFAPHVKCSVCQFRTGFNKERFGDVKRGDVCTRPACYEARAQATFDRIAEQAKKEGKKVFSAAESAQIFPAYCSVGQLSHDSPFVVLDRKPDAYLLKSEVRNPPKWRELAELLKAKRLKVEVKNKKGETEKIEVVNDIQLQIGIARDQAGVMREVCLRAPLIEGAEKAGEPIFRKNNERSSRHDDEFSRQQKEQKLAQAQQLFIAIRAMQVLYDALLKRWEASPLWDALEEIAASHGAHEAAWFITKWKELKPEANSTHNSPHAVAVEKFLASLKREERQVFICLTLIATDVRWQGIRSTQFKSLAELAKVDVETVSKAALAEFKKTKGKKPKAPKPAKKAKPETTRPPQASRSGSAKGGAAARAIAAVKGSIKKPSTKK